MLKHEISARPSVWERIKKLRQSDTCDLAPLFRKKIEAMLVDCEQVGTVTARGQEFMFDPIVFETIRVNELQKIYFAQGTTNASHAFYSWHFYGLAVDIISKSMEWSPPQTWWNTLGGIARDHKLRWGGFWSKPDLPHIQWGDMIDSPNRAPFIYFGVNTIQRYERFDDEVMHREGIMRVWKAVRAI